MPWNAHVDSVKTLASSSYGTHRFTYTELASYLTERSTSNPKRHVLRITVHVDGYPEQSYARAERFDGTRWHHLWELPGALLTTKQPITQNDEWTAEEAVYVDRRALLFYVVQIL